MHKRRHEALLATPKMCAFTGKRSILHSTCWLIVTAHDVRCNRLIQLRYLHFSSYLTSCGAIGRESHYLILHKNDIIADGCSRRTAENLMRTRTNMSIYNSLSVYNMLSASLIVRRSSGFEVMFTVVVALRQLCKRSSICNGLNVYNILSACNNHIENNTVVILPTLKIIISYIL